MKKTLRNLVSLLLASVMLISILPIQVIYAVENFDLDQNGLDDAYVHAITDDYDHVFNLEFQQFLDEGKQLSVNDPTNNFIGSIVLSPGDMFMYVDGVHKEIDPINGSSPEMIDGKLMLPVSTIINKIGGEIFIDVNQEKITISEADIAVELQIGSNEMLVNGVLVYLDMAPQFNGNTIMVPLGVLIDGFDFEYHLDTENQYAVLTRIYQTKRLIVKTTAEMDFSHTGGTVILEGPDNFAVLQFVSIRETKEAQNQLETLSDILIFPDIYMPEIADDVIEDEFTITHAGAALGGVTKYDNDLNFLGTGNAYLYIRCADLCGLSNALLTTLLTGIAGGPIVGLVMGLGHVALQSQCQGFGVIVPIWHLLYVPVTPVLWDVNPQPAPWRTVNWNANGGTVSPTSSSIQAGATIGTWPIPIRAEHAFVGWFDASGNQLVATTTMPNSNITYTARWNDIFKEEESAFVRIALNRSVDFHQDVAIMSADLSNGAYGNIEYALETLGFIETWSDYEDSWRLDHAAHAFGKRKLPNGTTVIAIAIRGTPWEWDEWISNVYLGSITQFGEYPHLGFTKTMQNIYEHLRTYMGGSLPKDGSVKYLITGHSRGAAVANLLAVQLSRDGILQRDVFNYNFAVPDVAVRRIGSWPSHDNIFNICNENDIVTRLPGSAGNIVPILGSGLTLGFGWGKFGRTMWWNGNILVHVMDYYHDRIVKYAPPGAGLSNIRNFFATITTLKCPVDVRIYDKDGIHVASIKNNEVTYYNSTADKLQIFIVGDAKNIIYFDGEEYRLEIIGTDTGVLDYTIASVEIVDDITDIEIIDDLHFESLGTIVEVQEQKRFSDIEIYDGRQMESSVNGNIDIPNTKVLFYKDSVLVGEILEDGSDQLFEYTVTFLDWNGSVLDKQTVEHFAYPTTPTDPERYGYTFIGWDTDFNYPNYTCDDMTITALYEINHYNATLNGNITGYTDVELTGTQKITVTLVGDTFANTLSGNWITNLPTGLTQSVQKTGNDTAIITINGTPTVVSAEQIAVTIPMGSLVTNNFTPLTAVSSESSVYDIVLSTYNLVWNAIPDRFTALDYDYTSGSTVTYIIENTGNQAITDIFAEITTGSDNFKILSVPATSLAPGDTANILINAKTGLEAYDSYTGILTVTWTGGNGAVGITQNLSQLVNKINYLGTKTAEKNVLSNTAAQNLTMELPVLPIGASYGIAEVSSGTDLITTAPICLGTILTFDVTEQPDGTQSVITIPVSGAVNYNDYEVIVTVTTYDIVKEGTPAASVDYINEALTGLEPNAVYIVDGGERVPDSNRIIAIETAWIGKTINIVKKGIIADNTGDSEPQSLTIEQRPNLPTPGKTDTTYGENNGVITGVDATMEYKLNTANTWIAISDTSVTGLAAETYNVRIKATQIGFMSESVSVTIAGSSAVTYNANSGNGTMTPDTVEKGGNYTIANNEFTRINYTFTGWNTQADGNDIPYSGGETITNVQSNITLYAQWTPNAEEVTYYTVTFDLNGGTHIGGGALTQTVASGDSATAPTVTRDGYTFSGWNRSFSNVTDNITVTAQWMPNAEEVTYYTVIFDLNGGTRTGGGELAQTVESGGSAIAPTVTRDGYTFSGWNRSLDNITADVAIMVQWSSNGSSSFVPPTQAPPTQTTIPTELTAPTTPTTAGIATINGTAVSLTINADGNVSLVLTAEDIAKYPQKNNIFNIEIRNQKNVNITLPISALGDVSALHIKTDMGTVILTQNMLQAYSKQYGDILIISIKSGSMIIDFIKDRKSVNYNDHGNPLIVSIPVTLAADTNTNGYVAVRKESSGNTIIPLNIYQDKEIIFQTPSTGTYDVIYNAKIFNDTNNHWAAGYITFTSARGMFSGVGNDLFSPDTPMTRAMFAQVLANIEGVDLTDYKTSRFTDVNETAWYMAAVGWAADKGIVNGTGDGQFNPEANVTREQMAVMLANYIKYKQYVLPSETRAAFNDESSISSWALDAVKMIQASGIVDGKPGNIYDPLGMATRAEVATIFARFVDIYVNIVLENSSANTNVAIVTATTTDYSDSVTAYFDKSALEKLESK